MPSTAADVHLQIFLGSQNSDKAATTISNVDYWIITGIHCEMMTKAASFAEVDLEVRLQGKVFRVLSDMTCTDNHSGDIQFKPYIIIPKNSDVRLRAISDSASGRDVSGEVHGVLAIIV